MSLGLVVFTALWGLAYGFLAWFPSIPIDAYWHPLEPAARYGYGTPDATVFVAIYASHTATNMMLDVLVLAVAAPLFFESRIRKHSYWGLAGLFSLGVVYVLANLPFLALGSCSSQLSDR